VFFGVRGETAIREPGKAAITADPKVAVMVLKQCMDVIRRRTVGRCVASDGAIADPDHPVARSEPQDTARVSENSAHPGLRAIKSPSVRLNGELAVFERKQIEV